MLKSLVLGCHLAFSWCLIVWLSCVSFVLLVVDSFLVGLEHFVTGFFEDEEF